MYVTVLYKVIVLSDLKTLGPSLPSMYAGSLYSGCITTSDTSSRTSFLQHQYTGELWWYMGQPPCHKIAHPGFESQPGASLLGGIEEGLNYKTRQRSSALVASVWGTESLPR